MKTLYLSSGEYLAFQNAPCQIIKRLKNKFRDDYALLEMTPPLKPGTYGPKKKSKLVIASAFEDRSLFPVSKWPVPVGIYVIKDFQKIKNDFCPENNLAFIDKGSLLKKPEADHEP